MQRRRSIPVADQHLEGVIESDRLHDLLRGPLRIRMRRHVDVKDAATFQSEHDEDVEDVESDRWHGEKVDRDRSDEMVAHKCGPRSEGGRRGRSVFGMYLATVFLSTQ